MTNFDKERSEHERDKAIEAARAAATAAWKYQVGLIIHEVAATCREFTTDRVLAIAEQRKIPPTHEPRALGGLMRAAAAQGLIEATDRFINTVRISRHRAPIRIWKSLVLKGHA